MATNPPTVRLYVSGTKQAVLHSLLSFTTVTGIVGVAVYLESQALQWIGAIFWMLWITGWAMSLSRESVMSIDAARAKLDEIEADQKSRSAS